MPSIEFAAEHRYRTSNEGIVLPVILSQGHQFVEAPARLDTGAADCLFHRSLAEQLGIDVESGIARVYLTMAGSFTAYGHEVTLRTFGLEWDALVYFHSAAGQEYNFLGRRGWLDHVRLGLVHYDESIYLSGYGALS